MYCKTIILNDEKKNVKHRICAEKRDITGKQGANYFKRDVQNQSQSF